MNARRCGASRYPSLALAPLSNNAGEPAGFCVYGPSRDDDDRGRSIGEVVAINVFPSEWQRGYRPRFVRPQSNAVSARSRSPSVCALTTTVAIYDKSPALAVLRIDLEAPADDARLIYFTLADGARDLSALHQMRLNRDWRAPEWCDCGAWHRVSDRLFDRKNAVISRSRPWATHMAHDVL